MISRVGTVAFQGIDAVAVDVQVMVAPGKIGMNVVGLPDKAVAESRERVQAALHASGLSLPPKKVTINLAPADLPKEGSHYDLPIALGLMAAIGGDPAGCAGAASPCSANSSLDGSISSRGGRAARRDRRPIRRGRGADLSRAACGSEAAWASPRHPDHRWRHSA